MIVSLYFRINKVYRSNDFTSLPDNMCIDQMIYRTAS